MKKILLLIAIIGLSSCSKSYRCQKLIEKNNRLHCIVADSVTTIVIKTTPADTIHDSIPFFVPQDSLDSLFRKDTCYTAPRVETILKLTKIKPLEVDSPKYSLKIWVENGLIKFNHIIKERKDTTEIKNVRVNKNPHKKEYGHGYLFLYLLAFLAILAFAIYIYSLQRWVRRDRDKLRY